MDKSSATYRFIHDLYEKPWVFNLNQAILDGGMKRQARKFLTDLPYESMVDIGCGTGNWAALATDSYVGVDSSPSFIEGCRKRYQGEENKKFVLGDAAAIDWPETFDLAILISVMHHLDDEQVRRLLNWVASSARHLFVLDLYPQPGNPISRWLYAHDRGDFIRTEPEQRTLLTESGALEVVKADDYYSPNRLYRHTLYLLRTPAS